MDKEMKIVELQGHLEAACNAAHDLKNEGVLDWRTYENDFNSVIATMEDKIRTVVEAMREKTYTVRIVYEGAVTTTLSKEDIESGLWMCEAEIGRFPSGASITADAETVEVEEA